MRRAPWIAAVSVSTACAFALGIVLAHRAFAPAPEPESTQTAVLAHVRAELASRYYRPVPERVLALGDVESMLTALDDPYTTYLDPASFSLLSDDAAARFPGIGLSVLPAPGGLRVAAVRAGPARDAGMRAGDVIVDVNRTPIATRRFADALGLMRGEEGTRVRLTVQRGARRLEYTIVRRSVALPSVSSRLLSAQGSRFGYVRLSEFRADAAATVRGAVVRLERARPSGLILDLRGNPGGLLDQAVAVTSIFLARGTIVAVSGAHEPPRIFRATGFPATSLPLVVLVDRGSASSAEIVAAALRDNGRALLVGERTFGKALVQSIAPLPDGGALKLTTAHYVTPAGVDISNRGIDPDVQARDRTGTAVDETVAAAIRSLSASTM